jgi:hypothetical protein
LIPREWQLVKKIRRTCGLSHSHGWHVIFCADGSFTFKKSYRKKMSHAFYVYGDTRHLSGTGDQPFIRLLSFHFATLAYMTSHVFSTPTMAPTSSETSGNSKRLAELYEDTYLVVIKYIQDHCMEWKFQPHRMQHEMQGS